MREKAVLILNQSKDLMRLCNARNQNGSDLFQDVILAFLELPEHKVQRIIEGGYLEFWAVRTACNLSSKSQRQDKFKSDKEIEKVGKEVDVYSQIDAKQELSIITEKLDKMYWYDRRILELYMQEGSSRKVSKITGIPYRSIMLTVNKVRNKLRDL